MFQFFKARPVPAGPHEFSAEIEIGRPAAQVFPLLDLADPRHAKRQLGDLVQAVTDEPGHFTMVIEDLPDAMFNLGVTACVRDTEYAFSCESTPAFGRVVRSHEHYRLEDLGNEGCRLLLTNSVEFNGSLRKQEYEMEVMMLTFACFNALAKIKIHAEQGVEAIRALSAGLDLDDIDCGND